MPPTISPSSVAALRTITLRLVAAAPDQLPQIAAQTAKLLWTCRDLLSASTDALKPHPEISSLVHKFKTFLTTLLQDRAVEARWAGVVLVKAALEASGPEGLAKINAWVRGLLAILKKKSDPPTTRVFAVGCLTRVFVLTARFPELVREITTPALPGFINGCLAMVDAKRCAASELGTVLNSFVVLVPRHPTIFRAHEVQIRGLIAKILGSEGDSRIAVFVDETHRRVARRLLVLLHHCAAKQGGAEKWDENLKACVAAAHESCDRVFRSFTEDWSSSAGVQVSASRRDLIEGEMQLENDGFLGMGGWKGIYAGAERVVGLLAILREQFSAATSTSVKIRVGLVMDLLTRISSLTAMTRIDSEVSREERETLLLVLPTIHRAAIEFFSVIIQRFEQMAISIAGSMLSCVRDIAVSSFADEQLRIAVYDLVGLIVALIGPVMTKAEVSEIELIFKTCCDDQLVEIDSQQALTNKNSFLSTTIGTAKQTSKSHSISRQNKVSVAATKLLPILLEKLSSSALTPRVRVQMERVAVLTHHKDALLASVLNPMRTENQMTIQPSLLPLLARQFPADPAVEALIRPRMPIIRLVSKTESYPVEEEIDQDNLYDASPGVGQVAEPMDLWVDNQAGNDDLTNAMRVKEQVRGELNASMASENTIRGVHDDTNLWTLREMSSSKPAKRQRSPSEAEHTSDARSEAETTPAAESVEKRIKIDGTHPSHGNPTLDTDVSQQPSMASAAPSSMVAGSTNMPDMIIEVDSDYDGSDFEMPPLTLEPDTEEEDEEED